MSRVLRIPLLALVAVLVGNAESPADQVSQLIAALDDANVRQGASIALAKLGEAAVPALRKSLNSENPDVRVWSAYTLGEIGAAASPAVGDLSQALSDSDPALRAAAAEALGKIGAPEAINALAAALGDESQRVRQHAAVALGQIGAPAHSATAKLIAALAEGRLRPLARDALIQIGPSAADRLAEALGDDQLRFDVSLVLQTVDPRRAKQLGLDNPTPADVPSLRSVLSDLARPPEERSAAAKSLAGLGDEGFAVLVAAFEQPQLAATAASAFAHAGPSAVHPLVEASKHARPEVRAAAADALGHIGPAAGDAAADLIRLLADPDRDVRYHSVRALHEFGPKASPAVSALTAVILNSQELEPTRQWAIKTLVVTLPETHDAVVQALVEASQEKTNYGVSQLAREQLRKIDRAAAEAAGIK